MASNLKLCDLDPELNDKLKKFRKNKEKSNAAIIALIDTEARQIKEDTSIAEELQDFESPTIEEVAELLPVHQPRFVIYRNVFNHDDGRVSYPMCFIFISPSGCKPEMQMMYAGSKLHFIKETNMTKVFEVRSIEELTNDWLKNKLSFF
ncbi:glia maturation factor gamma-like [Rhopilema esculentum]|uniref:glia maturation factor gamma-like n=1 Tax=Rhopilema esculentum TaxID=499914 RepID=UPI0031D3DCD4